MTGHECEFPEVLIEHAEDGDALRPGMRVLIPCECGETPRDEFEFLTGYVGEYSRALASVRPVTPLYHWSPAGRRGQILRYGLRPAMQSTTALGDGPGYRADVVCFADSPSWAWALSGGMRWTPSGEWDLWQTDLGRLTDPIVLPSEERLSGIYEVRTAHRVYKRDLWHVGTRVKR